MELPPRKDWPGLFGLIVLLTTILVVFQHYMATSKVHGRPKISGIIRYKQTKRVISENLNVFCKSQNVITYNVATNISRKGLDAIRHKRSNEGNEVRNIVLVKGHKVAGTTLQNILFRFALSRNLNVMVHKSADVINETGTHIDKNNIVGIPQGQSYNILCNHVNFNKQEISKFFPPTKVFIGILRHPLYQAASSFYYYSKTRETSNYKLAFQASPKNPFRAFINRPSLFDPEPPNKSFTNNRQAVDFGFPVTSSFDKDKTNSSKIAKFLKEVDTTFHLVIIADMFDESLILLRHLLGWKIEDILYTKLSIADKRDHYSDIALFSREDREVHRKFSPIDYALYDHFKAKLINLTATAGSGFTEELDAFQQIQTHVKSFCKSLWLNSSQDMEYNIEPNHWSEGFCVTADFCDAMRMEAKDATDHIRKRQQRKLGDSGSIEM